MYLILKQHDAGNVGVTVSIGQSLNHSYVHSPCNKGDQIAFIERWLGTILLWLQEEGGCRKKVAGIKEGFNKLAIVQQLLYCTIKYSLEEKIFLNDS